MSTPRVPKLLAMGAVAVGLVGGSYGIASAASGSSSGSTSATAGSLNLTPPAAGTRPAGPPPGATAGNPWGNQRSDETPLTGDNLAKATAAAKAKVSGGTIVRVETDADGHGVYEAHMLDSSGKPVTVYLDKSFTVTSVESR